MYTFESLSDNLSEKLDLDEINRLKFEEQNPTSIIVWAAETFGSRLIMTTSFGIHSAVMLHLVTRIVPDIPVIWIDTGYLFPETYKFAKQLSTRLNLNLHVYKPLMSPAEMEVKYGKLWERKDVMSMNLYNRIRKVEPMQRALEELNVIAWLAGLRSQQTRYRKTLSPINLQGKLYKILPIFYWASRDIYYYLQINNLPYHPLLDLGYVTVGDWHSSRPITAEDTNERDTRFQGLKQECGLHYLWR